MPCSAERQKLSVQEGTALHLAKIVLRDIWRYLCAHTFRICVFCTFRYLLVIFSGTLHAQGCCTSDSATVFIMCFCFLSDLFFLVCVCFFKHDSVLGSGTSGINTTSLSREQVL